jgi:hypothetical protein
MPEAAQKSPTTRPKVARLSAAQRSRLSNGKDILPSCDGRSAAARRYRDIASAVAADVSPHGADHLSEARAQLVRRFSACCVLAEQLEAQLIAGGTISIPDHSLLVSSLCRLGSRIGLSRVPKTVKALQDYLDDHADVSTRAEISEPAS